MADPDAGTVSVALAFLRSKHEYRVLELDADLVRAVIQRATERAQQGTDVIDERLKGFHEMHDNTIKGIKGLFTDEEMEQARIIYGNDNQSLVGLLRCAMKVVRRESPDETMEELREDLENTENELLQAQGKVRRLEGVLRDISAGRKDAAAAAETALEGDKFLQTLHSVGERLSRSRVWCHVCCSKEQELNTYDALNHDKWPTCCGRPMGIDSPAERQVEAENSL